MIKCPACGHEVDETTTVCPNCAALILANMSLKDTLKPTELKALLPLAGVGAERFPDNSLLQLDIEGNHLILPLVRKLTLGRDIVYLGNTASVDLSPYGAYRKGVSRRHAEIQLNAERQLEVVDLGSSNGTFLNGSKLLPQKAYLLHDGDFVGLGNLVIQVNFKRES